MTELPRRLPTVAVDDRVEKLTGIRKAMVKSMRDALNIPHFGYCDEISADSLIRSVPSFFISETLGPLFSLKAVYANMYSMKIRHRTFPCFSHA